MSVMDKLKLLKQGSVIFFNFLNFFRAAILYLIEITSPDL